MDKTMVVIVSEQTLFRSALALLLSLNTQYRVQAVSSWCSNLDVGVKEGGLCLFIVDADLPVSQICELKRLPKNRHNKVVFLGSIYNKQGLLKLMSLKADGYFTTDLSPDEFLFLLEKVERGGPIIGESLMHELVDELSKLDNEREESKSIGLTPREKEILNLLATGCTNGQIAGKLVISISTVKNHVHNILDKLEIHNRAQLISFALSRGLVSK